MVFLYYKIFKAIHERAKKSAKRAAATKSTTSSGLVIENINQTRTGNQAAAGGHLQVVVETDAVTTNTGSGSQPDEDDDDDTGGEENAPNLTNDNGCQVISNKQAIASCSGPTMLINTVVTETIKIEIPINGNTDSGYGPSNIEQETQFFVPNTAADSPSPAKSKISKVTMEKKNGVAKGTGKGESCKGHGQKKKPRFNLGRKHKSSRKKREKASAKKERKATKTLAIVLGMFLACWVPFFTCNILDAICIKLENDRWRPGMSAFLLTTWLGYINSCVNPVIYTIFNMEFRKAFKKLLADFWVCCSPRNS